MGLTVYYDWKTKADLDSARKLVVQFRELAEQLPFDTLSPIYEQDPPDGKTEFKLYDSPFRHGDLHLPRKRDDGREETVSVPALHAVFFFARIEGAETVSIGLASHPPVVIHREERITQDEQGITTHEMDAGDPIEFPTRRRGCYSWHSFCKTQYAGNPKLGGEANFLKAHLSLIELLDQIRELGIKVNARDDSKYAQHRDVDRLLKSLREWNGIVANFAGKFGDMLAEQGLSMQAPIKDRPDFEHLEADGIKVLQKLVARQRKRRRKNEE